MFNIVDVQKKMEYKARTGRLEIKDIAAETSTVPFPISV